MVCKLCPFRQGSEIFPDEQLSPRSGRLSFHKLCNSSSVMRLGVLLLISAGIYEPNFGAVERGKGRNKCNICHAIYELSPLGIAFFCLFRASFFHTRYKVESCE